MRLAQSLNNQKKMGCFVEPMVERSKRTIMTSTASLQTEGNVNNGSPEAVRTLCKQGRLKEALHMLHAMNQLVDTSTYVSLLQVCINKRALSEGKIVQTHMNESGFIPQKFLGNTLVNMYTKCESLVDARRIFDEMLKRDAFSWNIMIGAYSRQGFPEEALVLFHQMQRTGIQPNQFTFAKVLPVCAKLAALEQGLEIHEDIIRSGVQTDVFVESALVDMYAKCGRIDKARYVFDKMHQRNVVSWNAMIAGYTQYGHVDEALKLFQEMPEPDTVSWNTMMAGYAQSGNVDEAVKLFRKMPKPNVISWTSVIAGYKQSGRVDEALKLFQQMPERDAVSWTAMIAGYVQSGQALEALKLFGQMRLAGVKPDQNTFATVLPACANLVALEQGMEIHEEIVRRGVQSDVYVESALVDMYAKCGCIKMARDLFDKMHQRDAFSWTVMIAAYAMHGCGEEALKLFEQMQHSGMKPNDVTLVCVLSACCNAGLVDKGWKYFYCMSQYYHVTPTMEHYVCMVDLLGRAGRLVEAQDFINKMPIKPDVTVWSCLLGACRMHSNVELGEHVAEKLFQLDPKNAAPYVLLSNIYAAVGRWDDSVNVRRMMKARRIKKTPGCSWIEVNKQVHAFVVGDSSHPQMPKIYAKLERLSTQMEEAGYVPDTRFVLHDVEEEQKKQILYHHSEKLAIAFGLINKSPGTTIWVIKNLRVCSDCHSATKFISKIAAREIVVRDANRYHHFKDGQCSCGDYW
eukprot:Gb_05439 [translate_table: standard]